MKLVTYNFNQDEYKRFCDEFRPSGYRIFNYPSDKLDLVDCIVITKETYISGCYCISNKKFNFKPSAYYLPSEFLSVGYFFSLKLIIRKIELISRNL